MIRQVEPDETFSYYRMLEALEMEARAAYRRYRLNREDGHLPKAERLDPMADEYAYWWKRRFQCLMRIRRAGR